MDSRYYLLEAPRHTCSVVVVTLKIEKNGFHLTTNKLSDASVLYGDYDGDSFYFLSIKLTLTKASVLICYKINYLFIFP